MIDVIMTKEIKSQLFKKMAELESKACDSNYSGVSYADEANGFYKALKILGLDEEYINL